MPISYRIDSRCNLVLTTADGVLTDDDVLDHKRKLTADPNFKAGMCEITDIRDVTEFRVTVEGVNKMVATDSANASGLAEYKLAIIAKQDVVFGMARMYQTLTEGNVPNVRVFRDHEEAARWLGIALPAK